MTITADTIRANVITETLAARADQLESNGNLNLPAAEHDARAVRFETLADSLTPAERDEYDRIEATAYQTWSTNGDAVRKLREYVADRLANARRFAASRDRAARGEVTTPAEYAAATDALEAAAAERDFTGTPAALRIRVKRLTEIAREEYRTARELADNDTDRGVEAQALRAIVARRRAIHADMTAAPEDRAASVVDLLAAGREVMGDDDTDERARQLIEAQDEDLSADEEHDELVKAREELTAARAELVAEKERAEAWHRVADRVTVEAQQQRAKLAALREELTEETRRADALRVELGVTDRELTQAREELAEVRVSATY